MRFWQTNGSPNFGQTTKTFKQSAKKKRTSKMFAVPADHGIKLKENEKKDKYPKLARKLKKKPEKHEGDNYTNFDWCFWYSHRRIIKGIGGLGNKRANGDHPNNSVIENGQNTEKGPGDLRRLAITQTLVKFHELRLMWKTFNE